MPRPFNPNNYYGWRKLILERDKGKCVICGSDKRLEVDHIKSFTRYPLLRYRVLNGRTLCRECHKNTETYGGSSLRGKRRNQ